jgi:hypothetical protein
MSNEWSTEVISVGQLVSRSQEARRGNQAAKWRPPPMRHPASELQSPGEQHDRKNGQRKRAIIDE